MKQTDERIVIPIKETTRERWKMHYSHFREALRQVEEDVRAGAWRSYGAYSPVMELPKGSPLMDRFASALLYAILPEDVARSRCPTWRRYVDAQERRRNHQALLKKQADSQGAEL